MLDKKIIKLALDLIKIPSLSGDKEASRQVFNLLVKKFRDCGAYINQIEKNGFPAIVINLRKEKNPILFLSGHIDVVPALKKEFKPRLTSRRIYGRGSGDMKTAVAVMVGVALSFCQFKKRPSLGLMITSDEEIGGVNGTGYLLNHKKYLSKAVIIPDGSIDLSAINIAEKGVLHIKIKSFGLSAHASRPFLGRNALDELINIYNKLKIVIPPLKMGQWRSSLNLSKIMGGEAVNSVPAYGEIFFDIRYTKDEEKKKILYTLKKITKNKFEIITSANPFRQDSKNYYLKQYKAIAEDILKTKIKFNYSEGGSDARFFSSAGIPAIVTKIKSENVHGDGEWVDLNEAQKFYLILEKFIIKNCF